MTCKDLNNAVYNIMKSDSIEQQTPIRNVMKYDKSNNIQLIAVNKYNHGDTLQIDTGKANPIRRQQTMPWFHPSKVNNEAAQRMLTNLKAAQQKIQMLKKQCNPECDCKKCVDNKYTSKVFIPNLEQTLWEGYLMINPNTSYYRIEKSMLSYRKFWNLSIDISLRKAKFMIDSQLKLPIIKLAHQEIGYSEDDDIKFLGNGNELSTLFVKFMLVWIVQRQRIWIRYQTQSIMEGFLYKNYSISGKWERKFIRITKDQYFEDGEKRNFSSNCIWTNLQKIEFEKPHFIIKCWEGLNKVLYALPVDSFPQWLMSFLLLVHKK